MINEIAVQKAQCGIKKSGVAARRWSISKAKSRLFDCWLQPLPQERTGENIVEDR